MLVPLEREHPGNYVGFDRVLHYRSKSGAEIDLDDPRICAVPASMLAWLLDD